MAYDKIRNSTREVHSGAVTDGLAEFPQSQLQGIYVGVIKQVVYSSRNGHVKVYIPDFGGDPENITGWKDVIYASPFMGKTNGNWPEDTQSSPEDNTFFNAPQTYGFYMTPPDIGNEVLCFFTQNRLEGYWFACLNTSKTRQMIPAIGAVSIDYVDPNSIPEYLRPYIDFSYNYPVTETVVNLPESEATIDPWFLPKPLHENLTLQFFIQGLISDKSRGPINSSSQRDPISSVFGFSSPGRPIESQDPAFYPEIQQAIISGDFNPADLQVTARFQGHSFVMDDGDFLGKNNLIRLRTSAGHQLLMHDTDGFIYVSNSAGTAWVELTAGGDILIYGANDFAVRTSGNIMMTSDKSISFDATDSFYVKTGGTIQFESSLITAKGDTGLNLYGDTVLLNSQTQSLIGSSGAMRLSAQKAIIRSSPNNQDTKVSAGPVSPPQSIPIYAVADAKLEELLWYSEPGSYRSINSVVPTHEPFIRGDIAQAVEQQTDVLSGFTEDVYGNPIDPPVGLEDTGIKSVEGTEVTDGMDESVYLSQDPVSESIGPLDEESIKALNAQIGFNESESDYNYVDQDTSLVGKYGFDTQDLIEGGYVKADTSESIEDLQNPNNWRGKSDINNLDEFLNAPKAQEQLQTQKVKQAVSELQSKGLVTPKTPIDQTAGLINATLKSGINSVVNWATKGILPPSNPSALTQAYQRGRYSQTFVKK